MDAQAIEFNRGELIDLPWAVTASQYPNATTFGWKLQALDDDGAVEFEKTGTATVADLEFVTALTESNTLTFSVGEFPFTLWDTTNKRQLAFGSMIVGPAQS